MQAAPVYCRRFRIGRFCKEAAALILMLIAAKGTLCSVPVLSRLELIGSSRGLALTLGADAAFPIALRAASAEQKNTSVVSITCSNVVYGLSEYRFTSFPQNCPLKQITAHEIKGENAVELSITLLVPAEKNIRTKQKESRWVVLLSSAPVPDFAWAAQTGPERNAGDGPGEAIAAGSGGPANRIHAAAQPPKTSSILEDISILHRERVEKVIFKFDSPTEMVVKNMPDQIMVLFVNSKNGLSHATFKSEKDWLVKSIQLKEVAHGGTLWLGATIFVNRESGQRPLVQAFPDRLVIYSVRDTKQCLYMWSARNGTTLSYDFIAPQDYQVDYKHIEKNALTDSKTDMAKTGTFSVGEQPSRRVLAQAPQSAGAISPTTPEPQRIVRMVIIKDNVNLRSEPSSAPSSTVVARLLLGAIGSRAGKKGSWVNLEINGVRGWVMAVLVTDSAAAPKTLWQKIEAIRLAKEMQEKKTLEAKRLKVEQAALLQEKLQREEAKRLYRRAAEKSTAAADSSRTRQASRLEPAAGNQSSASALGSLPVDSGIARDSLARKKTEKSGPQPITYQVLGRDPFLPLSQDEDGPLLNIETIELVGILYDAADRIGLFEDIRNKRKAFALREKEPVKNGFLLRILPDKVLFSLNELGISRTYAMKLNKDKEPKAYRESPAAAR